MKQPINLTLTPEILESAMMQFWEQVAADFPDVKTGDFPPDVDVPFTNACETAIKHWLTLNAPEQEPFSGDYRTLRYVRDLPREVADLWLDELPEIDEVLVDEMNFSIVKINGQYMTAGYEDRYQGTLDGCIEFLRKMAK